MKGFLASMYVGLQIESNWTKKWVWLLYLAAYPVGSFLAVLILYGVFGQDTGLLPYALYGTIFYYSLSMVFFDMAFSVHDDREHYQTLKYIFLSSTSYRTYLCGRAATRYLIALAGIGINLCWLIPVLHLPFHPSWGYLAAGALLGFLVAAGLGMCMASVFLLTIKLDVDVVEALFGGMFVVSGALFPPTAFPAVFAKVAEIIPMSSFIELMRRATSGQILTTFLSDLSNFQLLGRVALSAAVLFAFGSLLVSFGSRQAQRKGYIDVTTAF
ncbi:MAG: ABC transporter permease [Candidatus Cryosericum sp.]